MARHRPSVYTRAGFNNPRRGPFRVPDHDPEAPLPLACEVDARQAQRIAHARRKLGLEGPGKTP